MPHISVILPVHNGANYLRESIDSVLHQSFRDFDLHVLDDGSTDESPDIAKEYAARDGRVRYTRNPGRFGLYRTLNRGCREATSEWVRLWAHDDHMTSNCLEKFATFVTEYPTVGMVYCDFKDMDEWGKLTGREAIYKPQRERTPDIADPDTAALLLLAFGCLPGNISTCMLRKRSWSAVGGFQEGIQQTPDYDMWTRLSEQYPMGFIPEGLVELRAHPLQLGRQGHKQLTTLEEMKSVFDLLYTRLVPRVMSDGEFRGYWRRCQGRGHVHAIARAALRGEFDLVARGVRAIGRYGMPVSQFATWLATANGRLFPTDGGHFFDRMSARLTFRPRHPGGAPDGVSQ
jgi:hypothetical protein